jgi:hypothetical protein
LKQILEFVVKGLPGHVFVSHLEQEAQAGMAWVCIDAIFLAMFLNGFIVCFKKRAERE